MSSNKEKDVRRLIDACISIAKKNGYDTTLNRLENELTVHTNVEARDFDEKVVVVSNWNNSDYYDHAQRERVDYDNLMERLHKALARFPGITDWIDQTTTCGGCQKLLNTYPTHYGWTPNYVSYKHGILCEECNEQT